MTQFTPYASIKKTLLDPLKSIFAKPATPASSPLSATPIPGRVPGEQGFDISGGGRTAGPVYPTPTGAPPASTAPAIKPPAPMSNVSTGFAPSAVPQVKVSPTQGMNPDQINSFLATQNKSQIPTVPTVTPETAPGGASAGNTPTAPSEAQKADETAQKAYEASLKITPDELATQEDLDKFYEATKLGMKAMEGQGRGINLGLIRGAQENLYNQSEIHAQTLETRLARMQASRQASLEASKFALDRADKKLADEKDKQKLISGTSFYDPKTGTFKQAPSATKDEAFTLGEGQVRYDKDGKVIATGPGKTVSPKSEIVKINGTDYMKDENGNFTIPKTPEITAQTSELKSNALKSAQELIAKFDKGEGTSAVGKSRIFTFGKTIPGTDARDFEIQFNNLKSLLSLDNVKLLKGQGQVSDAERRLLADASAKLDLAQSEDEFRSALSDVVKALSGTSTPNSSGQVIEYQGKRYQTDADGNFDPTRPLTNVGGDTNQAPSVDKAMESIGKFESGGNYKAVGNATRTGDKAYGKYQIMGANIPAWTKEALGTSLTVQQFLNNPTIQDAVAKFKMGQILKEHGTLEDLASVWFSGQPAKKAGNAKDVNNTSVPAYIANVRSIYNQLG